MDRTEPQPRSKALPARGWRPREISRRSLAPADLTPAAPFIEVLERRRSNRTCRELPIRQLGSLLWHGARVRETIPGRLGIASSRRPAPSAGGIHPIEIFVRASDSDQVERYDPMAHALAAVEVVSASDLAKFDRQIADAATDARGVVVAFIADCGRTSAAYEHAESLIWRDAGCLMMTLHLVSESMGLAFCPVGVLGTALSDALGAPEDWVAVGTCVVGAAGD